MATHMPTTGETLYVPMKELAASVDDTLTHQAFWHPRMPVAYITASAKSRKRVLLWNVEYGKLAHRFTMKDHVVDHCVSHYPASSLVASNPLFWR
jgi:hypothetical protein